MSTIQWRPEINAMTTPQSYWIRFVPRNVVNTAELAARMAKALPNYTEAEFRTFLDLHNQLITESLTNGEQVTEENAFTYSLSFTGRLDSPDDPLPPLEECLHVRVHASQPLVETVAKNGRAERLPQAEKLPLITTSKDTLLELKNVLNPDGALQLTGDDLYFDRSRADESCVIEGAAGGRTAQSRFIKVEESEIIFMPEIPAQAHPWNNEFRVSVTTRYSEHGTLRTGIYARMLRSPLTLSRFGHPNPQEVGILTGGGAASPYVSAISGSVSADDTLRIQAVIDMHQDLLLFSLLDMHEEGRTGAAVPVSENGEQTLQGFSGSAVSSLTVRVDEYAALKDMVRNKYGGRLIDVLKVETA